MTLKYIDQIPHHLDPEVRAKALRIFYSSRDIGGGLQQGNEALQHCENVAVMLVRTYTLMGNESGREYALVYAKVADLFGALWYYSHGAQTRIKYRALRTELYEKV